LFGYLAITTDFFIEHVIRKMGGICGLARQVAIALAVAFAVAGFGQLLTSLLFTIFMFLGDEFKPQLLFASYSVGVAFILVGGGSHRLLQRWHIAIPELDQDAFARKRAAVSRWGAQWLFATFVVMMGSQLIKAIVSTKHGEHYFSGLQILVAFACGILWATAYHVWQERRTA
jgi:hypothetical protein